VKEVANGDCTKICVLRDGAARLLRMRYFVDGIQKIPHPESV